MRDPGDDYRDHRRRYGAKNHIPHRSEITRQVSRSGSGAQLLLDRTSSEWTARAPGETITAMLRPGSERRRLARTLGTAYADGLLSRETFAHRIDQLFAAPVIDPFRFIGDLRLRRPERTRPRAFVTVRAAARRIVYGSAADDGPESTLLALDWTGAQTELLIGRSSSCDVVLSDLSVSRHHVRLFYRDGKWVLHDLKSTNGTLVNGARVGRCEVRPGDRLALGDEQLRIDLTCPRWACELT